ncbi:MAG: hypothetical protein ATN36_01095 [Epulopiscium sp. Nele67-Bin005]|nr:MAG: hypothetical protein ATN36_01095 [Epulopiscium sp. Nele67-Bin005]
MRKFLLGGALITLCSVVAGCGSSSALDTPSNNAVNDDKFNVLCSSYPVYEWTRAIVGDDTNVEVSLLMNNGVDPHNYQASASDIAKISESDLVIYIGGDSEGWIDDALFNLKDVHYVSLVHELSGFVLEENLDNIFNASDCCEEDHTHDHDHEDECEDECCEEDHAHDHDHEEECEDECCEEDHAHDHDHEEECEDECCEEDHTHDHDEHCDHSHVDEHIWLSAKLAKEASSVIAKELIYIDKEFASSYSDNLDLYLEELDILDNKFQQVVDNARHKTLIFGDRFPFRYLADDYNLEAYAAFSGCSTDTEASFETIVFLSEMLNETEAEAVSYISESSRAIANTVISSSNKKSSPTVQFTSMELVSPSDIGKVSYIDLMEVNLKALEEALK